ncbi:hypothetical protein ACYOEI_17025, partial [Singulisphaera rosea]
MQALASQAAQGVSGLVWLVLLHSVWLGLALSAFVALLFQGRPVLSHGAKRGILMAALGLVVVGSGTLAALQSLGDWRGAGLVPGRMPVEVMVSSGSSHSTLQGVSSATPADQGRAVRRSHPWIRTFGLIVEGVSNAAQAVRPLAVAIWGVVVLSLSSVLGLGVRGVVRLRHAASEAPR